MTDTTDTTEEVQRAALGEVRVEFACPSCGTDGYEETFDAAEVARATQVVIPCDDCSARIVLEVDVRLDVETTVPATDRAFQTEAAS